MQNAVILSHTNKYSKRIISNRFLNFYNNQNLFKKMSNNGRKMIEKSGCDLIVYNLLKKIYKMKQSNKSMDK